MHPETMGQIARQRSAEIRSSARFYRASADRSEHQTPIRHESGRALPTIGGYGAGTTGS